MIKSSISLKTSLIPEVEKRLNNQVKIEAESSMFYLSCASWCEYNGYENAAAFLHGHSEEERTHMMKIFKYINSSGGHAAAPEIRSMRHDFESLREIFELLMEHEIKVSVSINDMAEFCFRAKDFTSFNFLQWFIAEQREEEEICRRALELFDIIGTEGQGLWMIEQELAKLAQSNDAEESGANA